MAGKKYLFNLLIPGFFIAAHFTGAGRLAVIKMEVAIGALGPFPRFKSRLYESLGSALYYLVTVRAADSLHVKLLLYLKRAQKDYPLRPFY